MQGNNFQIDKEPLLNIPIVKPEKDKQRPFINLVDRILVITKDDDYLQNPAKQEKVHEYECQIDQMVYKFYNLESEDIAIIEGGKK